MNKASDIMTRCIKYLISLILILAPITLRAQNLYDLSHSREFAGYLMRTNQFSLATGEWERVLFLDPADSVARLNLIRSLRLAGNPAESWNRFQKWYPQGLLSRDLSREGIHLTLQQGNYQSFESILGRSTGITQAEKSDYQLGAWLLSGSWINQGKNPASPNFLTTADDQALKDLYARSLLIKRKSPGTAIALSALVPGLGKIYSGDWKDGLMTLLFVSVNAWQSYRGFSKNGIGSATGWIFGTMAAGFYTANFFGSWKSATDYNNKQTDRIRHEAEGLIYSR